MKSDINLTETERFLSDMIREAGAMTLRFRENMRALRVEKKGTDKDLVTEADQAVESFLRKTILERFPGHAILGEEEGEKGHHDCRWIIDPIDGTISFLHGQYQYTISIALEVEGEVVLAAVFAPALDDLFTARKGGGAFLNGRAITVSSAPVIGEAVLATGFPCIRAGMEKTNLPLFCHLMPLIRDVRRGGSAALELCFVACGQQDGYWEKHINLYDVAAGILLVREAGGTVTDYRGLPDGLPTEVLATNGFIHEECIRAIRPMLHTL